MQYKNNYAWMEGQALVVLRPEKAATFGHYNRESKQVEVTEAPANAIAQEKRALAHVLLPDWLYSEKRYQAK